MKENTTEPELPIEVIKHSEEASEVQNLLPKKQLIINLQENEINNNIAAWKEVVPNKIFNVFKNGFILPLLHKSFLKSFTTSFFLLIKQTT